MAFILFIFVALVGILCGVYLDQAYGPNNVLPECIGVLQIYSQDGEAYLFLNTDLSPEELAKHSEVILKVETPNQQLPL